MGCELGQVLSRFGVRVTIVEGLERLLVAEESEASELLTAVFDAEGIQVRTGARVEQVETRGGSIVATLAGGAEVQAERLLVAAGRTVDLSGLGLESIGVDPTRRFVGVDDHLRVADGIWAMGDVTGQGTIPHMAHYEGGIVAAGLLNDDSPPADFASLPRVTFTDPEIGAVGLSEAAAREAGLDVAVTLKHVAATSRGWIHGPGNDGFYKLIADRKTGLLVGATSAGPHGGEVLGMLSMAIQARVPIRDLQKVIYAYPTFYGGVGEAIGAYARGVGQVFDPGYAFDGFDFDS